MNHFKKLATLFIFFSSVAYAQNNFEAGYITKNDGTLIKGSINGSSLKKYTTKCKFKDKQDKITIYSPGEIKGFYIENHDQLFKTVFWGDDTLFAQVIIEGSIGLAKFNFGKRNFLLSKDELTTRITPKSMSANKTLKMLTNDCKNLVIDETFKAENAYQLVDKIEQYHECVEKPITYKYSDKSRVKFGVRILYDVYNLKFNDGLEYVLSQNFETAQSFAPALFLEINHPDISRHSSFIVDAAYTQRKFAGDQVGNAKPANIEFNSIAGSLFYRYTWFYGNFKPYLNAGPVFSLLLNKQVSAEYERLDGSINEGLLNEESLKSSELGVAYGLGLHYKKNWFLDVRVINGSGILKVL